MTDLIKLLEELLSLGSYPLNSIADPLVNKILSHPACNDEITKQVKQAVQREVGWLFCGLDFNALESRIDALITKDPAKLKIYIDGYDSHSYNAYGYWPHKMPEVRYVKDDEVKRTFHVIVGGVEHFLVEGEQVVSPDGQVINIEDLCKTPLQ